MKVELWIGGRSAYISAEAVPYRCPSPFTVYASRLILQPLHFTLAAAVCIMPTSGKAKQEILPCNHGNPVNAAIGVNSCNS